MKSIKILGLIILCAIFSRCIVIRSSSQAGRIATVRNNVCKSLKGRVVFYAIFVDSESTHPWTEYDINSTKDSIKKSIKWIENQALLNSIPLKVEFNHYSKQNKIPVRGKFKYETLSSTLFHYRDLRKGIEQVDKWSDQVSRLVARGLPKSDSKVILTQNRMTDRERLMAKLRDIHKTDNVALLFFINNYFENELSLVLHSASNSEVEYGVISEKRPSVIAHEFLHLFGALDLYSTPFDRGSSQRKKEKIMKLLPNEIMAFTHKDIDSLNISSLTKYLIGWEHKFPEDMKGLIGGKKQKFLEY